jgi:hypothetical protein
VVRHVKESVVRYWMESVIRPGMGNVVKYVVWWRVGQIWDWECGWLVWHWVLSAVGHVEKSVIRMW